MSVIAAALRVLKNPWSLVQGLDRRRLIDSVSDELVLKCDYRARTGRRLNLDTPRLFTEKLQWLKLHDRNPEYTVMVDKIAAKKWAADIIGEEYVTPTLAVWDSAEAIDVKDLPEKFVIKTNHDNCSVFICRDRDSFDIEAVRGSVRKHLKSNFYHSAGREWPYLNVVPRVFAEEYIDSEETDPSLPMGLVDYKFYCFNGEPKFLYVSKGLEDHDTATVSFLNMDWTLADFGRSDFRAFPSVPEKPECYSELVELARELSQGIPFVRVDLVLANGRPRFSEMTFAPGSGFTCFEPDEWNGIIGEWIDLSLAFNLRADGNRG